MLACGGGSGGAAGGGGAPGLDAAGVLQPREGPIGHGARSEVVAGDARAERQGGRRNGAADAVGVAPGPHGPVELLRHKAAAVGENAGIARAGGCSRAGGIEGSPVGGVAPRDDAAIVFDGGKGAAGGGNLLVAGARRLAGGAVGGQAPGKDRAVVAQGREGLLVGGKGGVAGARRRAGLRSAVRRVAPDLDRAVAGQRRKRAEVAELLAGDAEGVRPGQTGARGRPLAGQGKAGRDIQLQLLESGARGVAGRDGHVGIHRRAQTQLAGNDPGGRVEGEARGQHAVRADHQILDRVEVGVGGAGGAREAESPERLVRSLPAGVSARIEGQAIIDPHLQAPLRAHRQPDGQEGVGVVEGAGEGVG